MIIILHNRFLLVTEGFRQRIGSNSYSMSGFQSRLYSIEEQCWPQSSAGKDSQAVEFVYKFNIRISVEEQRLFEVNMMTDEQAKIIGKEIGTSVAYEMRKFFDELTRLVFYPRGARSSMLENFTYSVSESIKTGFKILADQARK